MSKFFDEPSTLEEAQAIISQQSDQIQKLEDERDVVGSALIEAKGQARVIVENADAEAKTIIADTNKVRDDMCAKLRNDESELKDARALALRHANDAISLATGKIEEARKEFNTGIDSILKNLTNVAENVEKMSSRIGSEPASFVPRSTRHLDDVEIPELDSMPTTAFLDSRIMSEPPEPVIDFGVSENPVNDLTDALIAGDDTLEMEQPHSVLDLGMMIDEPTQKHSPIKFNMGAMDFMESLDEDTTETLPEPISDVDSLLADLSGEVSTPAPQKNKKDAQSILFGPE